MFPLAHVYFSTKVSRRKSNLLLTGSILPDIAWTSKTLMDPLKIHGSAETLIAYLDSNKPEMSDLGEGIKLHLELDYFAFDYNGGYAINNAEKINDEVSSLLGIENGKDSLMMARNIIEAAVDLNLKDKIPEVLKLYQEIYKNMQTGQILQFLSDYLRISVETAEKEFNFFHSFINPLNLELSEKGYIENVLTPIFHIKFHKKPDFEGTFKLLQKTREITKPTFENMLSEAIKLTVNKS
jgi:hypothetical protein